MKSISLEDAKRMSTDENTTTFALRCVGMGVYKVFKPSDLDGAKRVEFYRFGYRTTYNLM